MPYIPPNTFVDNQTVSADAYNENIKAIADYFNESLDYTDITDGSVETQHISRPFINVISADAQQTFFQSSTVSFINNPATNIDVSVTDAQDPVTTPKLGRPTMPSSNIARANGFINSIFQGNDYYAPSYVEGDSETKAKPIPKSTMTCVVPETARALIISYSGELIQLANSYTYPADNSAKGTVIYIAIDGVVKPSTLTYVAPISAEDPNAGGNANYIFNRRHFTIHYLLENVNPGLTNISLFAGVGYGLTLLGKVSGVAEFIY